MREILQIPKWSCAMISLGLSMGMSWPEKNHDNPQEWMSRQVAGQRGRCVWKFG